MKHYTPKLVPAVSSAGDRVRAMCEAMPTVAETITKYMLGTAHVHAGGKTATTWVGMKPEVKVMWLEALRSGYFNRGAACLYSGTSFCCLGVLQHLYLKAHGLHWGASQGGFYYKGVKGYPEESVLKWAGLKNTLESQSLPGLARLNDMAHGGSTDDPRRLTFAEIADVIEFYF